MTLIEMEGFLSGKCLPGDMLVNETNAQYLHRKLSGHEATVANLTAQVQGLAAEGAALLKFVSQSCYSYDGDGSDVCDSYISAEESPWFPKTPATDAVLAEIHNDARAEGVSEALKIMGGFTSDECGDSVYIAVQNLASELRKEQGQ